MGRRRPALSREKIIEAAMALFDRDGLAGLTARGLARELGVSQMAMYRHFGGMTDIHGALLDRLVHEHPLAGDEADRAGESYRELLIETFCEIRSVLIARPDILPLLGQTAHVGVGALGVVERILHTLRQAGFDEEAAVTGFHTLLSYTLGACAIHNTAISQTDAAPVISDETLRTLTQALEERLRSAAGDEGLIEVPRHAQPLAAFLSDARFRRGLGLILDGLAGAAAD